LPDGIPPRPASDTQQLLKLMSMRSEIVEMGLAAEPQSSRPAIEELPPAAPSVLDQLVQARVNTEEQALAENLPTGLAAPLFADLVSEVEQAPAPTQRISTLEPEEWALNDEPPLLDAEADDMSMDEQDVDLLELNAAEAGQPVEIEPLDPPAVERTIEPDALLAQPLESIEERVVLIEDRPAEEEDVPPQFSEGAQLASAQSIEDVLEEDELESDADFAEGPGEDFQALLAGARQVASQPAVREGGEDDEDIPLLPADGDVKLRARNGPKPGAEFVGKTTLAGASGLYCLIERFNLPAGTRMKVTLTAPRFADRFDIQDAVVTRVRRAPGNTTEVQLSFEERHEDFEEFVARHFGDKPVGFALFTRRRPKR
jgi:hypothetical protein